jgi:hypothetical protein
MPKDIVVINGKEFEITVDGGSASGKDALLDLVNGRQGMPKDNQEVERIVNEVQDIIYAFNLNVTNTEYNQLIAELSPKLRNMLTTYGNARELAGVEDCIKLSDKIELSEPDGGTRQWMAFKAFRNTMRDRVATIKSEFTTKPGQTDMDRPLNFERE